MWHGWHYFYFHVVDRNAHVKLDILNASLSGSHLKKSYDEELKNREMKESYKISWGEI